MLECLKKDEDILHTSQIPVAWHPPGIKVLKIFVRFHPFSLFLWCPNAPLSYISSLLLKVLSATTSYQFIRGMFVQKWLCQTLTAFVIRLICYAIKRATMHYFKHNAKTADAILHAMAKVLTSTRICISPKVSLFTLFIPRKTLTNSSCLPDSMPSWTGIFIYLPRSPFEV